MEFGIHATNVLAQIFQRTVFRNSYSAQTIRRNMDIIAGYPLSLLKRQAGTVIESIDIDSLAAELISTGSNQNKVVLLLHSGGFCMGTLKSFRRNAWQISRECNVKVLHIEYRLAPEHPFPAALDDAKKAYQYLQKRFSNAPILLGGASAGAGLALALTAALRDENKSLPEKVFAICPWTDLTCSGESMSQNRAKDFWLSKESLTIWAGYYSEKEKLKDPYVSPAFADFKNFPPLLIFCGDQEVLLSDAKSIYDLAQKATGTAKFHLGKNMQHVWFMAFPFLNESRLAYRALKKFLE